MSKLDFTVNTEKAELALSSSFLNDNYERFGDGTKFEINGSDLYIAIYVFDRSHILIEYMPDFVAGMYRVLTDPRGLRLPHFKGKIMGQDQSIPANWLVDEGTADMAIAKILSERGYLELNDEDKDKIEMRLINYPWFERSYSCNL